VANIKSQIKRNRQNEKRRQRNKTVRSELKTRIKAARTATEASAADAGDKTRLAQKRLGKAAAGKTIHKNAAARRTSRLMRGAAK
jgi:small subunit ribosomal protein S20